MSQTNSHQYSIVAVAAAGGAETVEDEERRRVARERADRNEEPADDVVPSRCLTLLVRGCTRNREGSSNHEMSPCRSLRIQILSRSLSQGPLSQLLTT